MKYRWMVVASVTVLVLTFGGGMAALRYWYRNNLEAPAAVANEDVLLRIELGMSSSDVAGVLAEKNLIKNELAFRWYVFSSGLSTRLQAGLYKLHPNQPADAIAQAISEGNTETVTVTISSGLRLDQIKQILEQKGFEAAKIDAALKRKYAYSVLEDKPADASLEGYLFPDTYRLEIDQPIDQLIDLILANTDTKISSAIRQAWAQQGLDIHEGLTLGSIVQKEVSDPEDQKQVAQVFLKRLKEGRKLEADPTFKYASAIRGQTANIRIDSPYNTYLYKGLPPTPIANIELSVAEAVGWPAKTNWLFFLSDEQGNTHFTTNEAEHNQNIERYLR